MGVHQIPITKGGGTIALDTEKLPQEVYEAFLLEGAKAYFNKGMSKILTKGLEGKALDDAKAAAMAKAQETANELNKQDGAGNYTGKVKLSGRKAPTKGASGAVMTEARRLARNLVKDAIKREGGKVSHYAASEITKAANALLATDDGKSLLAQAEENLKARESKAPVSVLSGIVSAIKIDEGKKAKIEAKKKTEKAPLSATQAGQVAKRAKPEARPSATH